MNLLSEREIQRKEYRKACEQWSGITKGYILAVRNIGIIRPKNQEPFEGELILIASKYGLNQDPIADLTSLEQVRGDIRSVEDARKFEPGTFVYYLVILPAHDLTRITGNIPINSCYLESGKKYAILDQAIQAFGEKQC
jgi:hypothetical protein